jgi:hypothetical protein
LLTLYSRLSTSDSHTPVVTPGQRTPGGPAHSTHPERALTVQRTELLTAALAHAERGWHVFPLRPRGDLDNRKSPAWPAHRAEACERDRSTDRFCRDAGRHQGWEHRATTDPDRITRAWNQAPYGIGIACGPSGLVVVDLDVPKPGAEVPNEWAQHGATDGANVLAVLAEQHGEPYPTETFTVRTARGGMHLYFTAPQDIDLRNTKGKLGWLIDTRAHGGYVVGPPGLEGHPYAVMVDAAPAPLPGWLRRLLAPAAAVPVPNPPLVMPRKADRIAGLLRHVAASIEGNRNDRLFWAACRIWEHVDAGTTLETEAITQLINVGKDTGLPERQVRATVASAKSAVRGGV